MHCLKKKREFVALVLAFSLAGPGCMALSPWNTSRPVVPSAPPVYHGAPQTFAPQSVLPTAPAAPPGSTIHQGTVPLPGRVVVPRSTSRPMTNPPRTFLHVPVPNSRPLANSPRLPLPSAPSAPVYSPLPPPGATRIELGRPSLEPPLETTVQEGIVIPQRPPAEPAPAEAVPSADPELTVELLPPTPDADDLVPVPQEPTGPAIVAPGGPAERAAPINLYLAVDAPAQKQVESSLIYRITVRNLSDGPAENVVVESTFDDALSLPGRLEKTVRQSIGSLAPEESREVPLTLVATRAGRHCARFTVTSAGAEGASKSVCVEFVPKRIDAGIVGPSARIVGNRAEFTVKLVNISPQELKNLSAAVSYDEALHPREASTGVAQEPGRLRWRLGDLKPGESLQIQMEFECQREADAACLKASIAGEDLPAEDVEACLAITPVPQGLNFEINDTADPVRVNEQTEYVVTVENRGTQPLRGVRLVTELPAHLEFISAAVQDAERRLPLRLQVQANQLAFEPLGELATGKTVTYRIQMKAVRLGDGWLTARVTHAMSDSPVELSEPTTVNP